MTDIAGDPPKRLKIVDGPYLDEVAVPVQWESVGQVPHDDYVRGLKDLPEAEFDIQWMKPMPETESVEGRRVRELQDLIDQGAAIKTGLDWDGLPEPIYGVMFFVSKEEFDRLKERPQ